MTKSPSQHSCLARRGVTLIEAIAVIAVLGVIGSLVAGTLFRGVEANMLVTKEAELTHRCEMALHRIASDLRLVPVSDVDGRYGPALNRVQSTRIQFASGDQYALDGTDLIYYTSGSQVILASGVSAFQVVPLDKWGDPIGGVVAWGNCDNVHAIQLTLALEDQGVSATLGTTAYLRCWNVLAGGEE